MPTSETIAQPSFVDRLRDTAETLERLAADRGLLEELSAGERERLLRAVANVYSPDRVERRRLSKLVARQRRASRVRTDENVLHETGIRARRRKPVFHSPNCFPAQSVTDGFLSLDVPPASDSRIPNPECRIPSPEPNALVADPRSPIPGPSTDLSQHCYVCKLKYTRVHHFYDQLCPSCAHLNFAKRTELADLHGRVALLTGGRVKIGYQAGLKLLRSGARLIVTTRFPRDAAMRYFREPDFDQWRDRLEIFGLDLRHVPSVEALCRHLLHTRPRLDFIVNNACQTVRRPPGFYAHMMDGETTALDAAPEAVRQLVGATRANSAARLSQVALLPDEPGRGADLFPAGLLDQDLQQVDLRDTNSWRLLLAEVSTVELLEVHLVNAVAPFIFNARLKPLMLRTPERDKHIVNVSAVEGQFYRTFKTTRHPHTNMAKAALNMMTRTAAADYHQDGIHMNSVDTGWVTDEDPEVIAARKTAEQRFHPPLDIVDGAARILDPIITGFNTGTHLWGRFLKDYGPVDW